MIDVLPPTWMIAAIQLLGLPGLIFIVWHFDNRRLEKKEEARRKEIEEILQHYRNDVTALRRMYENNVRLVEEGQAAQRRLEAIYSEAISIVSLNTQAQTRLVEAIKGNMFCPMIRDGGR